MIQEELINNRPIVYSAYDSYAGGHAFNVDGYDANDDTYHINWGWSGDYMMTSRWSLVSSRPIWARRLLPAP